MKKTLMLLIGGMFGLLAFSACSLAGSASTPGPSQTPVSTKSLPTPVAPGQVVVYRELQVVMVDAEATASYINEYGSMREPRAGEQFLWVRINMKNIGERPVGLPETKHFSALYGTTEFKPRYGHRNGYPDYTALPKTMPMGQEVDAWLRFDVPAVAQLADLRFAFLPESSQVSVSFPLTQYPWGDHPIYLWTCAP